MKTPLPIRHFFKKIVLLLFIGLLIQQTTGAQTLSFKAPFLEDGIDLQVGAMYRFTDVASNVDALVTIEDLVNGATVISMDNNAIGYDDAFQPLISTPAGSTTSYALFSIQFIVAGSEAPAQVSNFAATTLDLDGNATLKEFSEVYFPAGSSTSDYTATNTRISVAPVSGGFTGVNIDGIERPGIDTSTAANATSMYTAKKGTVESFKVKFGAVTQGSSGETRQHSLYLKSFIYPAVNSFSTLPVKLISFAAILNDNKVDLKWITASEINVAKFVIEKSTDGIHFNDAGMMQAQGNATAKATYNFSDNVSIAVAGVLYYRLRSVDIDSKSELSETRIIRISKQTGKDISIDTYPNPVSNKINITIPATWQNKKVNYGLYDANGIVVKKFETTSSSQTEAIDVRNLASGVYIVKVNFEGNIIQQRIIKQ